MTENIKKGLLSEGYNLIKTWKKYSLIAAFIGAFTSVAYFLYTESFLALATGWLFISALIGIFAMIYKIENREMINDEQFRQELK
jgi:hypothetical protein